MKSTKKKTPTKSSAKLKDLNTKRNPRGGVTIGSATGGGGGKTSIMVDIASPKLGWIE